MGGFSLLTEQAIEEERQRLRADAEAKSAAAADAANAAAAAHAKLAEFERKLADLQRVQRSLAAVMGDTLTGSTSPPPPSIGGATLVSAAPGIVSDLTVSMLIDAYVSDQRSSYGRLRFATRAHYDTLMKRIREDCGPWKVGAVTRDQINGVYDLWTEGRTKKKAMGHALITMLRMLANFGFKQLSDAACKELAFTLHTMQFPQLEARTEELTAANADAIIKTAHEIGRHSIALAQAIQFECRELTQKDVIGEWVPITERSPLTDVVDGGYKWVRGLKWDEIDKNNVLTHTSSSDDGIIEINLADRHRVLTEITFMRDQVHDGVLPVARPMIICESTNLPWVPGEFRRWWRKIARECGVPDSVKNSDSRPSLPRRESRYKKKVAGGD